MKDALGYIVHANHLIARESLVDGCRQLMIECQKPVSGHGIFLRNAVGRVACSSDEPGRAARPVHR
jgi:hypothetical protein